MPTVRPRFSVLIFMLLAMSLAPGARLGAAGDKPAEYMFYQYPGVALVVKVDVPEAEFSFRVTGPDNVPLAAAAIPGRRLGPVFQYLAPSDLPRQLMIEVSPARAFDRSSIVMQVIQLGADDPNAPDLARAYRLFSAGAEAVEDNDTNTWVVKTYSLRNAAQAFAELGMEEMRLWSEYAAAHLVLYRLDDRLTAVELAREIQQAAERAGFSRVAFAALALEAEGLMHPVGGGNGREPTGSEDRALAVFARVAAMAEQQGLAAVQGRALWFAGLVLERLGRSGEALEKYSAALQVSAPSGDFELLTQLRNASAALQESMGRTGGAIEMLDQLAAGLADGGQESMASDLADGLFEKGRLLNANYRYEEAAVELAHALELQRGGATARPWGPTGLELAWSLYSMGDAEQAVALIQESLPRTPLQGNRELLARAYGSLARISLARGDFEQAGEARQRQAELTGPGAPQAALLFAMATDARLRHGPGSDETEGLLGRSRQAARAAGDALTEQRASLQLCLLAAERRQSGGCTAAEVSAIHKALLGAGVPRVAAEAALARARILRATGEGAAAWREMNALLENVHWFLQAAPGVLGAWYPAHAPGMFREYLDLAVAAAARSQESGSGGSAPLLALERVRQMEAAAVGRPAPAFLDAGTDERLRSALARREAVAGAGSASLAAEAREALDAARRACEPCRGPGAGLMSAARLGALLDGLGASEAVLAYAFWGGAGRAVLATNGGVRVRSLDRSEDILASLEQLRGELARAPGPRLQNRLASLGQWLLEPLRVRLPRRVYLLALGPLRGFPFDALRIQGGYLAERHEVVNLAGLSALARRGLPVAPDYPDRVFLAGDPRRDRDPFSLDVDISPEVAAVTDVFVGPGLHVIQGVALQRDEFQDDRFTGAALIHLAAPGRVDLAAPEASYLSLSGGDRLSRENTLRPEDVRAFDLSASLVVLSRTIVAGDSRSPLDSRMALVSDFLDAGAAAVIVSLWPAADADAGSFWADFYGRLMREPDIGRALVAARRARMDIGDAQNFEQWAGFQLFIR